MAEDSRDILMKMTMSAASGGASPPAECQALITPQDALASNAGFTFIPKAWGAASPNYFAIDDFTFEVALHDPAAAAAKGENAALKEHQEKLDKIQEAAAKMNPEMAKMMGAAGGGGSNEFKRYIGAAPGERNKVAKSLVGDLAEITISKRMDISSATLLQSCLKREQFQKATVLKRKATGAGELRTYLKIEFNQLMLTSFDWSDDDVVKETFKFVCRQAIVTYAVEDYGGKLLVQPATQWAVQGFDASS
jgi:type VI protein secretion system component Hcp